MLPLLNKKTYAAPTTYPITDISNSNLAVGWAYVGILWRGEV